MKVEPGGLPGGGSLVNNCLKSFMEVMGAGVGVTDKAAVERKGVFALLIDITELD